MTKRPRTQRAQRCPRCAVPLCLDAPCPCEAWPRIEARTRISIVVHFRELRKSSNTARVATLVLGNCRLLVRGGPSPELGREVETALRDCLERGAALLFPSESARELDPLTGPLPSELIVPDGTWSQARRLARRYAVLQALPAFRLPEQTSAYQLRRGSAPGQLCTSEAIASALRLLGEAEAADTLTSVLLEWQRRALTARSSEGSAASGRIAETRI